MIDVAIYKYSGIAPYGLNPFRPSTNGARSRDRELFRLSRSTILFVFIMSAILKSQ